MKRILPPVLSLLLALPAWAGDAEDATAAARQVLTALGEHDYERLYDRHVSAPMKQQISRDDFVAQVAIARSRLGVPSRSDVVGTEEKPAGNEPGAGATVWVVNFANSYRQERLRERLVMVKEADGRFRLGGIWATPLKEDGPR